MAPAETSVRRRDAFSFHCFSAFLHRDVVSSVAVWRHEVSAGAYPASVTTDIVQLTITARKLL